MLFPQRTTSLQSDSNFSSLRSYNSGGLAGFFSEPVQDSESLPIKAAGVPRPSGPTRSVSMDLSMAPVASELYSSSASSVDLFQLSAEPSQAPSVDLFQSSVVSAAPSFIGNQPTQTSQPPSIDFFAEFCQQPSNETSAAPSHVPLADLFQSSVLSEAPSFNEKPTRTSQPSSIDFFADHSQLPPTATSTAPSLAPPVDLFQSYVLSAAPSFNENQPMQTSQTSSVDFFANLSLPPSTATSDEKSLELSVPKNEGWAAFDIPQSTSSTAEMEIPAAVPLSAESLQGRFDPFSNSNVNMQLASFEISSVSPPPSSVASNLWHDGVWNGEEQVYVMPTNTQVSTRKFDIWLVLHSLLNSMGNS